MTTPRTEALPATGRPLFGVPHSSRCHSFFEPQNSRRQGWVWKGEWRTERAGLLPREVSTPACSFHMPPISTYCSFPAPSPGILWIHLVLAASILIQTCCSDAFNLLALDPKLVPRSHIQYFYLAKSKFWFPTLSNDLGSGLLTTHTPSMKIAQFQKSIVKLYSHSKLPGMKEQLSLQDTTIAITPVISIFVFCMFHRQTTHAVNTWQQFQ